MRRDSVTLEVSNVSWLEAGGEPRQPVLEVDIQDDVQPLRNRLLSDDEPAAAEEVDVTFRFQGEETGVMAITDRLTGEFILEANASAKAVIEFVSAVRRYAERTDGDAMFRTRVTAAGDTIADLEKGTLLVYADDGELLRQHSLIPSGVEI